MKNARIIFALSFRIAGEAGAPGVRPYKRGIARCGIDKLENFVFRLPLRSAFTIFAIVLKIAYYMMEWINELIAVTNDFLWTYVLTTMLIACALWFTFRSRFVQFRMVGEMFRLLTDSPGKSEKGEKHVSSFEAFAVSIASRVGTGNLAEVATAIALGGPGAVFWMWVIALLGSASAFVESTLAQLYKRKSASGFIGGPAYYMEQGLGKRWMGLIFAVLISITFGFAFNSVQSNTICAAWQNSFGISPTVLGIILSVLTLVIIFGGVHRIAKVSSLLVPLMAIGYILLALFILLMNYDMIPGLIAEIVGNAFGWQQAVGGGVAAALMQGMKRGLFSNEAGMGSAPNVAATANVTHPIKQGLIQALGVFTDTLIICTCTALIILLGRSNINPDINGIQLTQAALESEVGAVGNIFIAIAILLFAFSSIIGNYYYGEANIRFLTRRKGVLLVYRLAVVAMVMCGAVMSLNTAWGFADITMALLTIINLIAIVPLSRQAFLLLDDYRRQKRAGTKSPVYRSADIPELDGRGECWR